MAKHFVKGPSVGGDHLVRVWRSADIGPFIQTDWNRLCFERRDTFQVFLIMLVFHANLRGRCALPFDKRLTLYADLLAFLNIEALIAAGIEMLAEQINIIQAVGEQVAAPICR